MILYFPHHRLDSVATESFRKLKFHDTVQLGDTNLTAESRKGHMDPEEEIRSYRKTMGRKQSKRKTGTVLQILKTTMVSIIWEPSFQ